MGGWISKARSESIKKEKNVEVPKSENVTEKAGQNELLEPVLETIPDVIPETPVSEGEINDAELEDLISKVSDVKLVEQEARAPTPSLDEIAEFNRESLKSAETQEKNVLPSARDLAAEKLPELISGFAMENLKEVDTEEKIVLPTACEIAKEKTVIDITTFDQSKLKSTSVKVEQVQNYLNL